jgi:hypothetical protein
VTIPHTMYGLMATHVNELNNPDGRWVGTAAAAFLALARLLLGLGGFIVVVGDGTTFDDKERGVGGESALVDVVVSLEVVVVVRPRDGGIASERPGDRR